MDMPIRKLYSPWKQDRKVRRNNGTKRRKKKSSHVNDDRKENAQQQHTKNGTGTRVPTFGNKGTAATELAEIINRASIFKTKDGRPKEHKTQHPSPFFLYTLYRESPSHHNCRHWKKKIWKKKNKRKRKRGGNSLNNQRGKREAKYREKNTRRETKESKWNETNKDKGYEFKTKIKGSGCWMLTRSRTHTYYEQRWDNSGTNE